MRAGRSCTSSHLASDLPPEESASWTATPARDWRRPSGRSAARPPWPTELEAATRPWRETSLARVLVSPAGDVRRHTSDRLYETRTLVSCRGRLLHRRTS